MVKRVSTDEKLAKIVDFFKNTSTFYSIKELEKKIPKECGISAMLVPELIKKLLDESMICMEKCGSSNIYWCFQYQAHHHYSTETEKASLAIETFREENRKKREYLERTMQNREATPERRDLVEKYKSLRERVVVIEDKKKQSEACPMEEYERFEREIGEMKMNINKLVDGIYTLQQFVTSRFEISRREFNLSFGVEEDMDYVS